MHVSGLDHVNIRTADVPATARFYADLLGLEPGDPSVDLPPETARWLRDAQGRAIIHLYNGPADPGSTGAIHHIALNCAGKAELVARLRQRGAAFDRHEAAPGHTLIFTRDPHGILLELNFRDEPDHEETDR